MASRSRPCRLAPVGLALLLAVGAVACGDDSGGTAAAAPGEAPARIVSLSPAVTEILYAVGAGDQVVAVDEYSNHPAGVPTTELSGFTPNVEAVLSYEPDLVVLSDDANGVVAGLEAAGVEVLVAPAAATLEEAWAEFVVIGEATGHAQEAADVVAGLRARVAALVAQVPDRATPLTYFHELGEELYTATSRTFIGNVYALAGLENVADEADDGSGYPQLSGEFLLDADPDIIFLADTRCCGQSVATLAARPGWSELSAVAGGRVVELDDDVASRWGPRVVDLLEVVVQATTRVPVA